MDEKKVKEAITKEKETIKTLEDAVVSGKTGSLRRWAKDTIENSTIIVEALEKQLPEKVDAKEDFKDFNGNLICYKGFCPSCGYVVDSSKTNYCNACGQKLDWTVEE